jgi:TPR repeat protein
MIRLAQIEMCEDIKYWPEGAMLLMEAYKLGSQEAITQLKNDWHNSVKNIDAQRKVGDRLNKYEEFVLAFYYHYGIEVEKNEALALRLFKASANHGCDEAERFL